MQRNLRWIRLALFWLWPLLFLIPAGNADAATTGSPKGLRIRKVLTQFLDTNGVHTLAPSLLERDAYQAFLRANREHQAGLRFDLLLGTLPQDPDLELRVEAQGVNGQKVTSLRRERRITARDRFHRWQSLEVKGDDFRQFGTLTAWRATLWHRDRLVAEQKSFLW